MGLQHALNAGIVGRESEVAAVRSFVATPSSKPRALLIVGSAGIGKSTLWEEAVASARAQGSRVLEARPSEPEALYSFSGITALLDGLADDDLDRLPPRLRATLEHALFETDDPRQPEPRAVDAGLRAVVHALSAAATLVVAIDDVHWLDPQSANAIGSIVRRTGQPNLVLILTQRAQTSLPLSRDLRMLEVERIELGPLSLGATRRLLSQHVGLTFDRRVLRRIVDLTDGNPLFTLELGRALVERGLPAAEEDLPLPGNVDELLGLRLDELPGRQRKAVLAVALGGDLPASRLELVVGSDALSDAERAGVLVSESRRVRAFHPLLAAAARNRASASELRALHLELAQAVDGPTARMRHLAQAADAPDEELAARAAAGTQLAAARGAAVDAAELAAHAVRLTPTDSEERSARVVTWCERLMVAGDPERATAILAVELDRLAPGSPRARAHLMLADGRGPPVRVDRYGDHIDQALAESSHDPALHAIATARKSRYVAVGRVERLAEAESWSVGCLAAARAAGPEVEREALHGIAWPRVLRGRPIDDLQERFVALTDDSFEIYRSLDRVVAERHAYRGDVRRARDMLSAIAAEAEERGEDWSLAALQLNMLELELRAGEWVEAESQLDRWEQLPDASSVLRHARSRSRALLAAGRGEGAHAEEWAARALHDDAHIRESRWHVFEVTRAQALIALAAGKAQDASDLLLPLWLHLEREGVDDPGVFPIACDLAEALVATDDTEQASAVADRLEHLGAELDHPWARATAARVRGSVRLALGSDVTEAASQLESAAIAYADLGLRFDHARSLLALGRAQRRLRHWAAARDALERAGGEFDAQGSPGWAAIARSELARVAGRKPKAAGTLTPSERRVAELAAEGLSNKEIASTLVVTVHTVEVHLSHAYAKLGVRSRSQLAGALVASS